MLWALGDPARAKELIDEASRTTPPHARTYIDAFLTVYWFAMDQPEAAVQASKNLALDDLPVVGAEIAWALAQISADAGRTTDAVAVADAGYTVATRSLDAPHMRFNIADAEVSALLLSGQVTDALDVAERTRQQAADLPGAAQLLGAAVAGRAALGAGDLHSACLLLEQAAEGLSASHAIGWGYRYRVPHVTALAMRGFDRRSSRRACRARQGATPISVAGLRAEPGPGVGGRGPGRRQRGDHHLAVGGRKGQSYRAIRGGSGLSADRYPVR